MTFGGKVEAGDSGVFAEVAFSSLRRRSGVRERHLGVIVRQGDSELFTGGDLTGYCPEQWPGWTYPPLFTPREYDSDKKDTYTNVESSLAEHRGLSNDVEVYCANHHGSQYSLSLEFLEALDLELMVYSCGGLYGNPKPYLLEADAETAAHYTTSWVAESAWSTFRSVGGKRAGETKVAVDATGSF